MTLGERSITAWGSDLEGASEGDGWGWGQTAENCRQQTKQVQSLVSGESRVPAESSNKVITRV